MNNRRIIQFAVMCLEALDESAGQALSADDIRKRHGIPLADCQRILQRFSHAGIVQFRGAGKATLARPMEELTVVEIVEAMWSQTPAPPDFQMLVGGPRGMRLRKTLEAVSQLENEGNEFNG